MKMDFYMCGVCGKVIAILRDTGVGTICCGQPMKKLVPNRKDAAFEKHVPVFRQVQDNIYVKVGSEAHPMLSEHHIEWIGLQTAQGFLFKELKPGDRPEAAFAVSADDRAEAVYAFCNLHGLWCAEISETE